MSAPSSWQTRVQLLEAQALVECRCDIDHVYTLEEGVPRRGSSKCHPARCIFPDGDHDARHVDARCAPLKCFLNPRLLGGRALAKRAVHRNDYDVLTVAPQMRHLKSGHRVRLPRSCFSHVSWMFSPLNMIVNVDS